MNDDPNQPSQDELESLFVNNDQLDQITAYQNRFNPIRVMRMEGMEIRHSAILAWLLDPNENHGLDDAFLRAFLAQALIGQTGALTALDVSQADLRDAEIQREKRNIDIFVSSPSKGWAFVIENKFHSKQSEGQLTRYLERAQNDAREADLSFTHQGIFLTLNDEEIADEARSNYVSLNYSNICDILSSLITSKAATMGTEVRHFLEHYLDIIREAADMSNEKKSMERLARQLYRSHKKALDFIMEHGVSTDFTIAAEAIFEDSMSYGDRKSVEGVQIMYNLHNQSVLSFVPTGWVDVLGKVNGKTWEGCEKWGIGLPLTCWFRMKTKKDGIAGSLFLYAEVGPLADTQLRNRLIESIKTCSLGQLEKKIKFRVDATKAGARYSRFFNENMTSITDISDAEAIAAGMRRLIKEFAPVFSAVESCLATFIQEREEDIA